jgi:hypothetical protein
MIIVGRDGRKLEVPVVTNNDKSFQSSIPRIIKPLNQKNITIIKTNQILAPNSITVHPKPNVPHKAIELPLVNNSNQADKHLALLNSAHNPIVDKVSATTSSNIYESNTTKPGS